MKCGLKSMSRFNMDVKTLNNGVMDVKILNNGVNVVRGTGKKKSCSAVKFGMARDEDAWGAKMVQEEKILLHPLEGDWSAMFNIVCSSGPPSRVRRENSGNKSLAFAREKNDPQCQFFFFFLWEEGLNSMFSFLAPSCCNASLCGRAGWRADNESAEMWLLI